MQRPLSYTNSTYKPQTNSARWFNCINKIILFNPCFKIEEYRNTITFWITNPLKFPDKSTKHITHNMKQALEAKHLKGFIYYLHLSYLSICSETGKSNLQFFGQYNPHCCMLWPELKSTSLHTREKALAEKHC